MSSIGSVEVNRSIPVISLLQSREYMVTHVACHMSTVYHECSRTSNCSQTDCHGMKGIDHLLFVPITYTVCHTLHPHVGAVNVHSTNSTRTVDHVRTHVVKVM